MASTLNINQCAQNDKCEPVPNPGLRLIPDQYQIRDRDSDLTLNKTESKTETQIWL